MNTKDRCLQFREALPLLFAGSIAESDKSELLAHLDQCDECRKLYQQERVLFAMAAASPVGNPLTDHVASDLLDRYAFAPERLGETQKARLEQHLTECIVCRDTVQKIKLLPVELDDLVAGRETPLMSSLESLSARHSQTSSPKITKLFPAWAQTALAAAAAIILLLGISQYPDRDEIPIIEVQFPLQMRNADSELVFEIPIDPSRLQAKVFIDPEENHLYNLRISRADDSSVVTSLEHITKFDQQGFTFIGASIVPGQYFLTLSDIEEGDTLTQHQSFTVKLAESE